MEDNIIDLIEVEKIFLKEIQLKESIILKFQLLEKYELTCKIIEKLIHIQNKIIEPKLSLLELNSALRFVLETLIQSELLIVEPEYTFKLYYAIYIHHVEKTKKFINRIKSEIQIMEFYEQRDLDTSKIIIQGKQNNEPKDVIAKKHKDAQNTIDEEADLEFTIFSGNYKFNGYGYTKTYLESEVLPQYEQRLIQFQEMKTEVAKIIVKQDRISNLFNFKDQHSKVFSELKDNRSWEKKADKVGLLDQYRLIYDFTSALLHCTSYSLKTNNEFSEGETTMAKSMIYKYSKKILKNLKRYSEMNFFSKFKLIELTDEK